jgi:hypothetical protein
MMELHTGLTGDIDSAQLALFRAAFQNVFSASWFTPPAGESPMR